MSNEPLNNYVDLVSVTRGKVVENIHQGIAIAMDSNYRIIKKWGDTSTEIFPRSALKPIQTFGIVSTGTDKALKLKDEQIALATSSHHAEPIHVDMVKSWLKELKLEEEDLTLGSAWPLSSKRKDYILRHEGRKSKLYNNCSGKHCGQLSICIHQKFKTLNYQDQKHSVQKLFIQNLEKLSETKINYIGIDGCGLPAPSLPLERFAFALTKFADPAKLEGIDKKAAIKVFECCVKYPVLFGGSESVNSILTKSSKKRVLVKNGADGVFSAIIPDEKMAIVVKIKDGNTKAAEVAIAGLLKDLKILNNDEVKKLINQPIYNSAGKKTGAIYWNDDVKN
jgi:L-asparaginase II